MLRSRAPTAAWFHPIEPAEYSRRSGLRRVWRFPQLSELWAIEGGLVDHAAQAQRPALRLAITPGIWLHLVGVPFLGCAERAREAAQGREAVNVLADQALGVLAEQLNSTDERVRQRAAFRVLEYAFGRPRAEMGGEEQDETLLYSSSVLDVMRASEGSSN